MYLIENTVCESYIDVFEDRSWRMRMKLMMPKLNQKFNNNISKQRWTHLLCGMTVFLLLYLYHGTTVYSEHPDQLDQYEKVLFISSYHPSFPTIENQIQGIKAGFGSNKVILDVEYMDMKRFDEEENRLDFKNKLQNKLEALPSYDAIIVGDDAALQFAMDYRTELFNEIPIVFLGINSLERAQKAFSLYNMTGVAEVTSVKDTLSIITKLQPELKNLYVIADDTITGRAEYASVLKQESEFSDIKFNYVLMKEYSYDELSRLLMPLNDDSSVLLLSAYVDRLNQSKNFYEILEIITLYTSVPVYHLYDFGIGEGLIGGKVVNFYEQGYQAAQLAEQLIQGVEINVLPPVFDTSLNTVYFDYSQMIHFNLDPKDLPNSTKFVNKPVTYWETHAQLIITSILIISVLLIMLFLAFVNIQKRKVVEKQLQKSNEEIKRFYDELLTLNEELEASEEELRANYDELERTKKNIQASEERYKNVFELSNQGMWEQRLLDEERYLTRDWYLTLLARKSIAQLELFTNSQLLELFYSQLDEQQANELNSKKEALLSGKIDSYRQILTCCSSADKKYYIEERAQAVYNKEGTLIRIIGSHNDMTNAITYERQLESLAYEDQLTKIYNRIALERYIDNLDEKINEAETSGCILLMDLDNFKFVNNTYGHEIGDELLIEVAKRLQKQFGDRFRVGRINGDEFAIVCPTLIARTEIEVIANDILSLFDAKFRLRDHIIYISASIGISLYPENGLQFDVLINHCNSALSDAKINGKNRYEFYDIATDDSAELKIYIQNNIREAMVNNRFSLYYQPIYSVSRDSIIGFEALIRWKDELKGFISPSEFIVVAEKMGIITKIGDWVIQEAAKFVKFLLSACNESIYVSINVSAVQLMQQNFIEHFFEIIDEVQIPYHALSIEITETALMQSFEKNVEKVRQIQAKGIRISLDDFGTGYSSLSYLRRLPINILKIDKSFIDEIAESLESREVVEGVVLLAQKMGIYVVAEGIEHRHQLDFLKDFKCDGIQGYYISKPLPSNEVKPFFDQFTGI